MIDLALLIGMVGLVMVGMEAYIRRGVQGKIKDVTDHIVSGGQSPDEGKMHKSTRSSLNSTMETREFNNEAPRTRSLKGDEYSASVYNQHSEE